MLAMIQPTSRITRKPINFGMKVSTRFKALANAVKIASPQLVTATGVVASFHHTVISMFIQLSMKEAEKVSLFGVSFLKGNHVVPI
jgi:hypothetical protein